MSPALYIARINAHIKLRTQLLAALDKAINEVGAKKVALAIADKAKARAAA